MHTRRWLPALIILAAAAALGWWGARMETVRTALVESLVATLVDPHHVAPDDLPITCGSKLEPFRADTTVFTVQEGDGPYGDGSATHTAMLIGADGSELGLRILADANGVRVIGCWDAAQSD